MSVVHKMEKKWVLNFCFQFRVSKVLTKRAQEQQRHILITLCIRVNYKTHTKRIKWQRFRRQTRELSYWCEMQIINAFCRSFDLRSSMMMMMMMIFVLIVFFESNLHSDHRLAQFWNIFLSLYDVLFLSLLSRPNRCALVVEFVLRGGEIF